MDMKMLYISLWITFGIFLRGETSPISGPPCRAKVCDDRPECPKSSCRCLFPSKIDCDVYYQCVSGKPYHYKCSSGLLFNAETLSCDYEHNVNCSYGRTTETSSSSAPVTTRSNDWTTKYTLPPSTKTNHPANTFDTTVDGDSTTSQTTNDVSSTDHNLPSTNVTEFSTPKTTDDFSTQDNEGPLTSTFHPSDDSSSTIPVTTSSDPQMPDTTQTLTTVVTSSHTNSTRDVTPTSDRTDSTIDIVTVITTNPTSDTIITGDVTGSTSRDVDTEPTSGITVSDATSDTIITAQTKGVTGPTPDEVVTTDKSSSSHTTVRTDPTPDVSINTTTSNEETSKFSFQTTAEEFSTRDVYISTGKSSTEQPTEKPSTNEIITDNSQQFECPSRFGLYPDSFNCSTFYQCSHWTAYQKECPSDLHFNPSLTVCDWPERAGCDSASTKDQPSTAPSIAPPSNNTYCDCDSCDLPVPDDCSSYLLCIERSATMITCSEGLYYNSKVGTCDFQDNVECETVECPSPDGRFAYPHSCTHFMECADAKVTVRKCPDDMMFDASGLNCSRTGSCSDPEISTTQKTSVKPTETTLLSSTTRASTPTGDSLETFSTELTTADKDPVTRTSSSQTPSTASTENQETTQQETTEKTPTSAKSSTTTQQTTEYTMISRTTLNEVTTPEETSTASSTSFSTAKSTDRPTTEYTTVSRTTLNEVTTPEKASSASSSTAISTERPATEYTTISKTTLNEVTTPEETSTTASESSSTAIYTEIPTTEYTTVSRTTLNEVTTTEGTSTASSSSSSTAISTEQPRTEYTTVSRTTRNEVTTPEETSTASSASSSTVRPTTEYTTVSRTTQNERTSTSGSISPLNFECPSRFGLFPDQENCFRFYHCSHWIAHHKWCPSDLHFNPTLQVCDWPYRAGCGETPAVITAPDDEDKSPASNTTCDCECCFTPNPDDCSRYSLCLDGKTHEGQCANGLLFNPLNSNCDLAERVNCSKNPVECPTPEGVVANPKNCSSFYKCDGGTPLLKQCPGSYHFSRSEKSCVEPCRAKCDRTLDCQSSTLSPKSEICIEDEALYRASNCSSFYQCIEGQAYLVQCPNGLHFNIEYGVCEHPCDALCDPNIECKRRSVRSLRCPSLDGLFPVPDDCGSFYMCSNGVEHQIHCPPGLHFRANSGTCEEPCEARCSETACKPTNLTSNASSLNPDYKNTPSSVCETPDGVFPNPKDCGSFYQCKEGVENLVHCPVGLHFSAKDKICESPCVANCDTSIEDCPTEIPNDEGNCTCQDCYLPDPTDCSAFYFCSQHHLTKSYCPYGTLFDVRKGRCEPEEHAECETIADPAMCSSPFGFDPYPGDCGKFVHCLDSVAYVKDCEPGLEFDPVIRACANPNGRCGRNGVDSSCLSPTGTFPHPENSSLFYQCEYGVAYLKECPNPLVFNSIHEVCDWPSNFRNEGQTIYHSEAKAVSGECSLVPGVICPCACRVTTYDECNSFYHCQQDGTACKKFCPEGLYFNRRKMVCDLPENVECRDFFFTAMNKLRSLN